MTAWVCRQTEITDPRCKNHKSHHKNQWNVSSASYNLKTLWCSCPLSWGTKKPSNYLIAPSDIVLIKLKGSGHRSQRYTTVMLEYITKHRKKYKLLFLLSMTIQSLFQLEAKDSKFKEPSFFMLLRSWENTCVHDKAIWKWTHILIRAKAYNLILHMFYKCLEKSFRLLGCEV